MPRSRPLLAVPVIASLVTSLYVASWAVVLVLGLPKEFGLPWPVRVPGFLLIGYGLGMLVWVLRFRGPEAILRSTWITLLKLFRQASLDAPAGRTESLVVAGPYRLVRHPLYSGVDGLAFGFALLADHSWAYLAAVLLALWLAAVLAPFEERELRALFGRAYAEYMRSVRRFLPIRRRA